MFELMLMRHAKSDWHSHTTDIVRPLNARGAQDAIRMGAYLAEQGLRPDKMVVSTAWRAQETSRLLQTNLPVAEKDIILDKELYMADWETLRENIEAYATDNRRLLLLAHNPGMDDLVSYLASTPPPLSDSGKLMTTCAVACFHINSMDDLKKAGQCELQQLIRPKEITAR
jgi:phosphohistidine phosphatase